VRGLVTRQGRAVVVVDPEFVSFPKADLAALAAQTSIKQLFEVRKLLEVRVAAWAAARATAEDIKAMRLAIEGETITEGNRNRVFHDTLATAAHNPALIQIYESGRTLFFRLPFFWKLFDDDEVKTVRAWRHELARRWHEQILHAIEQHDGAEAEGAMFQHLDIMEKDLLNRLRQSSGETAHQDPYSHPLLVDIPADKQAGSERKRFKR
jgi:GntR family transcriptional regulator, transcriptional repressor for pyruvate dehydrogenase complex